MLFSYKGVDSKGIKVSARIDAKDISQAKQKIKSKNIFLIKIKEDSSLFHTKESFSFFKRIKKITPNNLSNISRDLAIYMQAGISLANAISLIANQYASDKDLNLFFSTIKTSLDEGNNFHQALDSQRVFVLPEFYKQAIKVSEDSGILDTILLELAKFLKNQDRLAKKLSSAFAYPVFIIIVSLFLVAFMMSVVVPKITGIFTQMHQELPAISQFTINMADFITNNAIVILSTIMIAVTIFTYMVNKSKAFKYKVDFILLKLPFFGSLIQAGELTKFSYMISVLLKSGVTFVQAIKLSSNILSNSVIKTVFQDASNKVVEGEKLSKVLNRSSYKVNASFIQSIALGEETSELTQILNNLSVLYEEESSDKIDVFLSLLEPMLMLVVGGVIGFIVIAMLLPIFSMSVS